jgi:hypothetical protein
VFSGKLYEPVAKSQLKKVTKLWQQEVRKAEEKAKREAEAEEATKKRAEEAKKVTISEDASLPKAERMKISQGEQFRGKRVKVHSLPGADPTITNFNASVVNIYNTTNKTAFLEFFFSD